MLDSKDIDDYRSELKKIDQNQPGKTNNAFSKPVLAQTEENGEKKPVKFLGTFGKKKQADEPSNGHNNENCEEMNSFKKFKPE